MKRQMSCSNCFVCHLQCLVWDYDSRGKHDFIGEFYTNFKEMQKISLGNKVRSFEPYGDVWYRPSPFPTGGPEWIQEMSRPFYCTCVIKVSLPQCHFQFQRRPCGLFCVSEGHVGVHQSKVQAEEKELQELGSGYSQRSQGKSRPVCVHINTFDNDDVWTWSIIFILALIIWFLLPIRINVHNRVSKWK